MPGRMGSGREGLPLGSRGIQNQNLRHQGKKKTSRAMGYLGTKVAQGFGKGGANVSLGERKRDMQKNGGEVLGRQKNLRRNRPHGRGEPGAIVWDPESKEKRKEGWKRMGGDPSYYEEERYS